MVNSRRKGLNFEREIVNLLKDELGDVVDEPIKRVLDQYREGALPDIVVSPFAIECKRYSAGCCPHRDWWDQVVVAATANDLIPALVYRFDRQKIQCILPLYAINSDYSKDTNVRMTMDWADFVMIVREGLEA